METKNLYLSNIVNAVRDIDTIPYVITTKESRKKHYKILIRDRGLLLLTTIKYKGIEGKITKLSFKPYGGEECNLIDKDLNYIKDILKGLS